VLAMGLVMLIGVILATSTLFSFASFVAFRKILFSRLRPIFQSSGNRLTVIAFNKE
jgi:hypothetical protein